VTTSKPIDAGADPAVRSPQAAPPAGEARWRQLVRWTWYGAWALVGLVAGYMFGLQLGSVLLGLLLAPLCALALATTVAGVGQFAATMLRRLTGAVGESLDR
jgi:hypothetical protein